MKNKIKNFFNLNFWQSFAIAIFLLGITSVIGYINWDWVKEWVCQIKDFLTDVFIYIGEFLKENIWIIAKTISGILIVGLFRWIIKTIKNINARIAELESDKKNAKSKKEIEGKINNLETKFNQEITKMQKEIEKLKQIAKPSSYISAFTDPRDGYTYRTVRIGEQVWMAENLAVNYAGSKCYGNDLANGAKYGRLYDWETAKKAVPPGWHLPTNEEWETLVDFVGGEKIAGTKLKAANDWNNNGNGTDEFGFNALPGGLGYTSGNFGSVGNNGFWWSASEYDRDSAYAYDMNYSYKNVVRNTNDKPVLFSVRCVKD